VGVAHDELAGLDVLQDVEGADDVKGAAKRHPRGVELNELHVELTGGRAA
jgi:hypothetical protein